MAVPDYTASTEKIVSDVNPASSSRVSFRAWIPARYILALLGFGGFCIAYALRVNLSVGLVAMVNRTATEDPNKTHHESVCTVKIGNDTDVSDDKDGEFVWDQHLQGIILASFFYGYVVTQIPGGRLAEKFGTKWFFGVGVLSTAVLTILSPVVARLNVYLFIALRVLEGLAEGVTFPAMHAMLARWLPKYERGRLTTFVYSGAQVGTVITMPIAGALAESDFLGGWPSVFYVFGVIGCVWFLFWAFCVYETPSVHPRISEDELKCITENQDQEMEERPPIPWKDILKSPAVWAITITHFGQNWGFYTLLTYLPQYFKTVLNMDIKKDGSISAIPYVMQTIFAWIAGYIGDYIRKKGYASVNTIRKTSNSIAFFGPALCLLGVTLAKCDETTIITLFSLAMGFNGLIYSGFMVTHVDMSPDFAGTLMGITNGFGNIAGILAPMTIGAILEGDETDLDRWATVFYIAIGAYVVTAFLFIFLGSANLQPWGVAVRDLNVQVESPNAPRISSLKSIIKSSDSLPPYTSLTESEQPEKY